MKTIKRLFAPLLKLNVASLLTLVGIGACAQNPGYKTLNADEFEKAIADKSVVLIDVRTAAEYAQAHLPDAALNIDVLEENFAAKVKRALQSSSAKTSAATSGNASASATASTSGSTSASSSKSATTVAIYCRSGRRSKNATAPRPASRSAAAPGHQHLPDGSSLQRPDQQLRHGALASNKPHPAEKSTPVWLAIWRTWAGFANSQLRCAAFRSTY